MLHTLEKMKERRNEEKESRKCHTKKRKHGDWYEKQKEKKEKYPQGVYTIVVQASREQMTIIVQASREQMTIVIQASRERMTSTIQAPQEQFIYYPNRQPKGSGLIVKAFRILDAEKGAVASPKKRTWELADFLDQ